MTTSLVLWGQQLMSTLNLLSSVMKILRHLKIFLLDVGVLVIEGVNRVWKSADPCYFLAQIRRSAAIFVQKPDPHFVKSYCGRCLFFFFHFMPLEKET